MRKIYKVIGSMLAAGALVAGIGSGVAFAEYSSFEYGGEVMLAGSERFTKTLEYKVSEKTDVLDIMTNYYHCTVVEDVAVPKNKVQVVIAYLSDNKEVAPEIIQNKMENPKADHEYIYVDSDYQYNDFRDMIRIKEPILSDLKNHKISDYQLDKVEKIEVHVNPKANFTIDGSSY